MLRSLLNNVRKFAMPLVWHRHLIANIAEQGRRAAYADMLARTPDNPALRGFKAWSQTDEDGIIEEIFRRLGGGKSFIEIGCGDGLENNTHYLLLKGWSGLWIDGGTKNVAAIRANLPDRADRLEIREMFLDADNVATIAAEVDFLSIDVDGNDLHLLRSFLQVAKPRVICAEYNAKFPPPTFATVAYDKRHVWKADDYMGASLTAFVEVLRDYTLVCCGIAGLNAYFVRSDSAEGFTIYPPEELYQPSRISLFHPWPGHPSSYGFLANELKEQVSR